MGYFKWRGGFFYRVWHLNAKYYSNGREAHHRSFRFRGSLSRARLFTLSLSLSLVCAATSLHRGGACPWDKRLHFLIFKCAQTSYPANPPTRSSEVPQRGFRVGESRTAAAPRRGERTCGYFTSLARSVRTKRRKMQIPAKTVRAGRNDRH